MSSPPQGAMTEVPTPDYMSRVSDPMYTVEEVAEVLQKSVAWVYLELRKRDGRGNAVLVSVTVGKARRVRRSDLEAYIAALVPSIPDRPRTPVSASS